MAVKQISLARELEKNPDIRPEEIEKIRSWLRTQPHLPGDLLSDVDLLVIYHCCEKSLEITKQVLDLHYTLRTLFTQFFKDRTIDRGIEATFDTVLFYPMPTLTTDDYRYFYVRLIDLDPKNFHWINTVRAFISIYDLMQYEEGTWPGFVVIIDMEGSALGHLARVDLMSLKKVICFVQECMFVKLKEVAFINAPSFIDKLLMMMRPFMNKSLLDIIKIYAVGDEGIYKKVPKRSFPKDFGGEYKDAKAINSEILEGLKANKDFFISENKRRVNENLRPGKPSAIVSEYGTQGNFKKLDID